MSKSFYIGVDSIARKAKKAYIGVNGVARKIKKMYIGVAGVARLFFSSGGEIKYHGTATPMSIPRQILGSAKVGNYALFAGNYPSVNQYVDVYNSSLTKSTVGMSTTATEPEGVSFGNYAIFLGDNSNKFYEIYDESLTHKNITSGAVRTAVSGASNGTYALFAGGTYYNNTNYTYVEALNSSLTLTGSNLTSATIRAASASSSNYAAFRLNNTVDVFDTSMTKTNLGTSITMTEMAGASIGDYMLFAGGQDGTNTAVNTIEIYDNSLTKTSVSSLSVARCLLTATTIGEYVLFAGGTSAGQQQSIVDVCDSSLTLVDTLNLSEAKSWLASESVGEYVLFAGGSTTGNMYSTSGASSVVDVFVYSE